MSSNYKTRTRELVKKYFKQVDEIGEENLLIRCVRESAREQAGLPARAKAVLRARRVESKDEPRKCHGTCKNFSAAQYGTGSCGLSETPSPVAPDHEGCEDWECAGSIGISKESALETAERLFVESRREEPKKKVKPGEAIGDWTKRFAGLRG